MSVVKAIIGALDEENKISWYIENAGTGEVKENGQNGRKYLEKNLN